MMYGPAIQEGTLQKIDAQIKLKIEQGVSAYETSKTECMWAHLIAKIKLKNFFERYLQ